MKAAEAWHLSGPGLQGFMSLGGCLEVALGCDPWASQCPPGALLMTPLKVLELEPQDRRMGHKDPRGGTLQGNGPKCVLCWPRGWPAGLML